MIKNLSQNEFFFSKKHFLTQKHNFIAAFPMQPWCRQVQAPPSGAAAPQAPWHTSLPWLLHTSPVQQNKNKATVKAEMVGLSKDPVMLIAEFLEHMEKRAVAREEQCAKELEEEWQLWAEELEEQCKLRREEMQLHWEELKLARTKAALEKQQ